MSRLLKLSRLVTDMLMSSIIGLFVSYALVGFYDLYLDGVPVDGREAGGRFELFYFTLVLWPICSLLVLLLYWLLKKQYPSSVYVVLQSIFMVSLLFSIFYLFARNWN